jgi:hypothetical protein
VPHLEALIPLLDDKDEKVVQAVAEVIHDYAPKGSAAARALSDRKLARDKTGRFVPTPNAPPEPAPPGVAELVQSLTDGKDDRRAEAALDLGDKGAAAKAAVPVLKKLLTDPDPALRFAAGYALARIENDLPALRRLLTGELERAARGRYATWVAAVAFERLPPNYPELIPLVARWLEREGGSTVMLAGLRKYGPKAKDAVPAMQKVLRGPGRPIHAYFGSELPPTCAALGAIGPDARAALPELRQRLDTGHVEVALAARDAIRKITGEK